MQKTILIIGAGSGISLATAERFSREGFRIILAARKHDGLNKLASSLRTSGADVIIETVDAANAPDVFNLIKKYSHELDIIHYNAGVLHYDEQGQISLQQIEKQSIDTLVSDIQVNISSALVAIHASLPEMIERKSGTIFITGGGLALAPSADLLTLSVGKAGIRATVQALFEPLKKMGIHISTVTVSKLVSPNSQDSRNIANQFWDFYTEPKDSWTWEKIYS